MPIFFRNTPLQEPFTLDSAGLTGIRSPGTDRRVIHSITIYKLNRDVAHLLPAAGHSCLQRVMGF